MDNVNYLFPFLAHDIHSCENVEYEPDLDIESILQVIVFYHKVAYLCCTQSRSEIVSGSCLYVKGDSTYPHGRLVKMIVPIQSYCLATAKQYP